MTVDVFTAPLHNQPTSVATDVVDEEEAEDKQIMLFDVSLENALARLVGETWLVSQSCELRISSSSHAPDL